MRALPLLGFLAAAAAGGEEPPPASPYAALGFPVTFDGEILTPNDIARFLETPLEQIDPTTLVRQRDYLVLRKLSERIAGGLGIEVSDREVDEQIRRETDMRGGDAKFYEWLAQQGQTLERFKLERRQQILESKLRFLFQTGISHDGAQLLPWRVRPTPREIETAFRNDAGRRGGAVRVRRLEFTVDADRRTRDAVAVKVAMEELTPEAAREAIEAAARSRLEAALAALEERPFADVAREHGANVEAMAKEWVAAGEGSEAERFLAKAEVGSRSSPFRLPDGRYQVVQLLQREDPEGRKATDPDVAEEYDRRIRALRANKWEALLRLRALDAATVEPARVRDDVRKLVLAGLREADAGLKSLGLR